MPVKYSDIAFAFDYVNSGGPCEHEAYINIHTGETYWYSAFGDNEEPPEDLDDNSKYISVPHKNDFRLGKRLVLKFTYQFLPEKADEIETIFSRKGAYARFKDVLQKTEMIEQWYDYENKAQERAMREWCELNEIEVID